MNNLLLINPPVYDFAAFDLWSKPLGLLYLTSILQKQGSEVTLLDYMDRNFLENCDNFEQNKVSANKNFIQKSNEYGCGHYIKTRVQKPDILKNIPRYYCRYGLPKEFAYNRLKEFACKEFAGKKFDLIIVTSIMTYWYLGVFEAIETVKNIFPDVPVVLGGAYATLCFEHAQKSGADIVLKGNLSALNDVFKLKNIKAAIPCDFKDYPIPYYPPNQNTQYAVLRISQGCPFRCAYCAQDILTGGKYYVKSCETVFNEIKNFAQKGIKNIVFYDDALLYNADNVIKPLLRKIISANLKLNIHTPNGLHLRYLDLELARLMKQANFISPRFSLETVNPSIQKNTGAKVSNQIFEEKVAILNAAGFQRGQYIIYLLMGMPQQSLKDVEESIQYAHKHGGKVSLSQYSPIPHTSAFGSFENFINEPLLQNKSVYPLYNVNDWEEINRIKNLAIKLNSML
ncbi:MAG: radical SAM protein [Endomicrobium sp.]|jgi:radical SAM superfamily enzyme YgiQ (UPF0313 family)|nr:radical SAM protein [Endomicrobium sp.]